MVEPNVPPATLWRARDPALAPNSQWWELAGALSSCERQWTVGGASEYSKSDPGSHRRLRLGLGRLCPVSGSSGPRAVRHQPAFATTATDQPTNWSASCGEAEEGSQNAAHETAAGSGPEARPTVNRGESAAGLNHPGDSGCQATRLRDQPDGYCQATRLRDQPDDDVLAVIGQVGDKEKKRRLLEVLDNARGHRRLDSTLLTVSSAPPY